MRLWSENRRTIARGILLDAPILILDDLRLPWIRKPGAYHGWAEHLMAGGPRYHRPPFSTVRQADLILVVRAGQIVERGPLRVALRGPSRPYRT
jgi:hypothetical protein